MSVKQENYVHSKDIDLTRGFAWDDVNKKLWIDFSKLIDNQFLVINPSSGKVTVNSDKFDELKKHINDQLDLLKQNLNSKVDGTTGKINDFDSTLKNLTNRLESEGNPVKIKPNGGLVGNGTTTSPLGLNLKSDDLVINSAGELELAIKKPSVVTNLNNNLIGLGFHTFSGFIDNTRGNNTFVQGVPKDYQSEAATQQAAGSISDLASNQNYDFNGYYVASEHEVVMTIFSKGVTWTRNNSVGMNTNGTIKDTGAWGDWRRESNINVNVALTEQHTKQIQDLLEKVQRIEPKLNALDGLGDKVNSLEGNTGNTADSLAQLQQSNQELKTQLQSIQQQLQMPCEMTVKTVSNYTITNTDNVIVCTGGTITIPDGLTNGRMFTVIQSAVEKVTLQHSGSMEIIPPLNGSSNNLSLAGQNAVVSILIINNKAHVFGQME